jgi:DNA-binding PadR family transcriptional regulator
VSPSTKLSQEGLLILMSLAGGEKHGYAIQQDIARSAGRTLGPGSLYGAIARLETAGCIEPLQAEGTRRPYRLTEAGADALRAEVESLRQVTRIATRRLALR